MNSLGEHVRHVLRSRKRSAAGAVAVVLVTAMVLASCGSSTKGGKGTPNNTSKTSATGLGIVPNEGGAIPGIKDESATKPTEGGSMTFALDAESTGGWCLAEAQLAIAGIQVARSLYDYLTVPDDKGGYQPDLATAVTPNSTYTSWTIKVRPGITFSDGTPLNAQVVADNLNAYRGKLPTRSPLLFIFVFDDVSNVTVVDPMTVRVDMKTPWVSFPAHLYQYGRLGIMGERQLKDGKNCFKDMVGTGPFMFQGDWVPNDHLTVVKNPHYWRKDSFGQQLPYLDKITFRPVPDPTAMLNGFNSKAFDLGNTDDTTTVVPGLLPAVKSGTINLAVATSNPETAYTIFNTGIAPFNNILARKAFATAYNFPLYDRLRLDSLNNQASGPFGPGVLGYVADTGFPKYDLTAAKALVAQYKQTTGQDLKFTLSIPNDAASQQSAAVVQSMMQAAGMTMTLKPEEQSTEISDVIAGSYQAAAWRNHPGFDPDTQWVWWHCTSKAGQASAEPGSSAPNAPNIGPASADGPVGNNCDNAVNFSKFNDPEINKDLETGRATTDPTARANAYEDLNKEFAKEVWEAWGYWSVWTMPYQTNVHGILGPNLPTPTDPNVTTSGPHPYTGLSSGTDVSGLWKSS
jgi:peptide/nickel transport system substrate-binding protein